MIEEGELLVVRTQVGEADPEQADGCASLAGLLTLVGVHALFLFLRRSEAGDLPSDAQVFGTPAQLVLPFNDAGLGMVSFRANGQVHEMPARRADEVATLDVDQFADCRIEYIENGVAVVQPGSN